MADENSDRQRFDDLCRELNLDDSTAEKAWTSYEEIRMNYTLEGDSLQWLTCAVFATCRQSVIPTVGNGTVEGNCMSPTRLLRYSKLSIVQFFNKMKNWADMANLPQKICDQINKLERNFAVSAVIFKKYQPIFYSIFKKMQEERPPRGRRQRRLQTCSSGEVFSFCWTLFILVKGHFPAISDDLVNSYHLLLCCIDLLFANAVLAKRRDLLQEDFEGLPSEFYSETYSPPYELPCIMDKLCEIHDGLVVEAKGIKEHWWKPHLSKLFQERTLTGLVEAPNLSGLLDITTFESNFRNVKREYDEYVLTQGDFDERIFLEDDADQQIGTPSQSVVMREAGNVTERVSQRKSQSQKVRDLCPQTPLTGRHYLREKETKITPVSTATQIVSKLQAILSGRKNCPSETLKNIFKDCKENPEAEILQRVGEIGEQFCQKYTQPSEHGNGSPLDFAKRRLRLAESLYYSILENIMLAEMKRLPEKADLSVLLGHDTFHKSLFACCLEIVIFAYNSQRVFPWIIEAFDLPPYQFFKVIELLLRAEDGLPRDLVKHLNFIEEDILQDRAWRTGSPLWDALRDCEDGVPSCEDVTPPNQVEGPCSNQGGAATTMPQGLGSPVHPRIRQLAGVNDARKDPLMSPTSVHDRFGSPAPGSARRRLFADEPSTNTSPEKAKPQTQVIKVVKNEPMETGSESGSQKSQSVPTSPIIRTVVNTPNTVLSAPSTPQKQTIFLIKDVRLTGAASSAAQKLRLLATSQQVQPQPKEPEPSQPAAPSGEATKQKGCGKPKRGGSIGLFFRKVYHMANLRLLDLCSRLGLSDDLRRMIWTCLEHSLVNHVDLMQDRHLDQLILCAVYIICKVTKNNHDFREIMKCYRRQPQAVSHTYRSVFLHRRSESGDEAKGLCTPEKKDPLCRVRSASTLPESTPPTPTRMTGTSSSHGDEVRGDLIAFYNNIYVRRMGKFATKFSRNGTDQNSDGTQPPLSPLPVFRKHQSSPRKISSKHKVYVSPIKRSRLASPERAMTYLIQKSPVKTIHDINRMVRHGRDKPQVMRAINLHDETDDGEPPAKVARVENGSMAQRLQQLAQESMKGSKLS